MKDNGRAPDHPIQPMFLERWSPRAFTSDPISTDELLTMLEASRWAASSYNSQPWRFVYALRSSPDWNRFLQLLVPFNQVWAKNAAALVFFVSNSTMRSPRSGKEVPSPTHSFDTGAAAACFALQANAMAWYTHGMVGFDAERAFAELRVPKGFNIEAVFAVGKRGDPERLPEELRAREVLSGRRPLSELAFEGAFSE